MDIAPDFAVNGYTSLYYPPNGHDLNPGFYLAWHVRRSSPPNFVGKHFVRIVYVSFLKLRRSSSSNFVGKYFALLHCPITNHEGPFRSTPGYFEFSRRARDRATVEDRAQRRIAGC